ncbi:MAG: hypothetical protein R3C61_18810 [Bacteroidia bacterium]
MYTLLYIAAFSILIPVIASIRYYRNQPVYLRLLSWFLWICALTDLSSHVLAEWYINTDPSLHIYTIVEFAFLILILQPHLPSFFTVQKAWYVILLFSVFGLYNMFFLQGVFAFNSYALAVESIAMIMLTVWYFYHVLQELSEKKLTESPIFWISTGILTYFSVNLFMYIIGRYLSENSFAWAWAIIHNVNYILRNLLFFTGIWKTRKPLSKSSFLEP